MTKVTSKIHALLRLFFIRIPPFICRHPRCPIYLLLADNARSFPTLYKETLDQDIKSQHGRNGKQRTRLHMRNDLQRIRRSRLIPAQHTQSAWQVYQLHHYRPVIADKHGSQKIILPVPDQGQHDHLSLIHI